MDENSIMIIFNRSHTKTNHSAVIENIGN